MILLLLLCSLLEVKEHSPVAHASLESKANQNWQSEQSESIRELAFRHTISLGLKRWRNVQSYTVDYLEGNHVKAVEPLFLKRLQASRLPVVVWNSKDYWKVKRMPSIIRLGNFQWKRENDLLVPVDICNLGNSRFEVLHNENLLRTLVSGKSM